MASNEEHRLPGDLDSVYYSYVDNTQYFMKGDHVWRNVAYDRMNKIPPYRNSVVYYGTWSERWYDICDVVKE